MSYSIQLTQSQHAEQVVALYRSVAAIPGGLARDVNEISSEYIHDFLQKSFRKGLSIAAFEHESGQLIAEIHGYSPEPKVFSHVISDVTIAVHPQYQGKGIGSEMFRVFIQNIREKQIHIRRIELIARESNGKAIELYQRLGFVIEGKLIGRINGINGFEADIPMALLL